MGQLDEQDESNENDFLGVVWAHLRAGRLDEAQRTCRDFKQYWRAACLEGSRVWLNSRGVDDPQALCERIVRRAGWKRSCRVLANSIQSSRFESAIFGRMGGLSAKMINKCRTWRDHCWAHFTQLLEATCDRLLFKLLQHSAKVVIMPSPAPLDSALRAGWVGDSGIERRGSAAENIFDEIRQGARDAAVRAAADDPFRVLQKFLVMPKSESRVQEELRIYVLRAIADSDVIKQRLPPPVPLLAAADDALGLSDAERESFLRFAAHLYLYLHLECATEEGDADREDQTIDGGLIMAAYVACLVSRGKKDLVLPYVRYLKKEQQVHMLSAFLQGLLVGASGSRGKAESAAQVKRRLAEAAGKLSADVVARVKKRVVSRAAGLTSEDAKGGVVAPARSVAAGRDGAALGAAGGAQPQLPHEQRLVASVTSSDAERIRALLYYDRHSDRDAKNLLRDLVQLFEQFVDGAKFSSARSLFNQLDDSARVASERLQQADGGAEDAKLLTRFEYWADYATVLNHMATCRLNPKDKDTQRDCADAFEQFVRGAAREAARAADGGLRARSLVELVSQMLDTYEAARQYDDALGLADLVADRDDKIYKCFQAAGNDNIPTLLRRIKSIWLKKLSPAVQGNGSRAL